MKKSLLLILFCGLISARSNQQIVLPGAVGAWHFNEGVGGTAYDVSGNNNHGAISGALYSDDAIFDKALDFQGTGGVLAQNSASLDCQYSYTVSAWVKFANVADAVIMLKGTSDATNWNYALYFVSSNVLDMDYTTAADSKRHVWRCPFSPQADVWYMLTSVHDTVNNVDNIYVNGERLNGSYSINSFSAGAIKVGQPLYIGYWAGAGYLLNGNIDSPTVYNRALSAAEIKYLYSVQSEARQ